MILKVKVVYQAIWKLQKLLADGELFSNETRLPLFIKFIKSLERFLANHYNAVSNISRLA